MRQEDNSIITLCPSIGQFFINELPLLLLCVAMLLIGGLPGCLQPPVLPLFTLPIHLSEEYPLPYRERATHL
jgi:hypothetical protein